MLGLAPSTILCRDVAVVGAAAFTVVIAYNGGSTLRRAGRLWVDGVEIPECLTGQRVFHARRPRAIHNPAT